ncbi:MAG: PhzF family phenazine biosynthesis protein [Chryseolinea sp.]
MNLPLYQIDAFSETLFSGNPACVVPLTAWLPDSLLLNIAKENAVAETAYFIHQHTNRFLLRWFTPEIEMDLCGHATLAAAHAIRTLLNLTDNTLVFETLSGDLKVTCDGSLYHLDFPSRKPSPSEIPASISRALNIQPNEVLKSRDYVLVYETEQQILDIQINRMIFDEINLDPGGVIVTAKGDECDFVSRYFTPQAYILEDAVTGSAHCSLIPYWSERLKKTELNAMQLSERRGKLYCKNNGDRVIIGGKARTYSVGTINLE